MGLIARLTPAFRDAWFPSLPSRRGDLSRCGRARSTSNTQDATNAATLPARQDLSVTNEIEVVKPLEVHHAYQPAIVLTSQEWQRSKMVRQKFLSPCVPPGGGARRAARVGFCCRSRRRARPKQELCGPVVRTRSRSAPLR